MKCPNCKNGMKIRNNNKLYPFLYAIASFVYTIIIGVLNHHFNSINNPWANLAFLIPHILLSIISIGVCLTKIKNVKPSDIYAPPIMFTALYLVCSYGLTLIFPDVFLRQAYWSCLIMYVLTGFSIVVITVIPKIPRKCFVILSYIGILLLLICGIVCAVSASFAESVSAGTVLEMLLIIKQNISKA